MSEKLIQQQIFRDVGGRNDVRIFRNNVGTAWMGKSATVRHAGPVILHPGDVVIRQGRRVHFGLHKGSGDLIGWRTLLITPSMVGRKIAQFLSMEVKIKTGRVSADQQNWHDVVIMSGGSAGIVRSVGEAQKTVNGCL